MPNFRTFGSRQAIGVGCSLRPSRCTRAPLGLLVRSDKLADGGQRLLYGDARLTGNFERCAVPTEPARFEEGGPQ